MNKRIPIFIGIILVFLAVWLLITPTKFIQQLIGRLDNLGYDLQLKTQLLTHTIPKTNVAIVDIDDKSIKVEGHWPWPRTKLADLSNKLKQLGAAVIAFDIFFSENEKNIAETFLSTVSKTQRLNPDVVSVIKKSASLFNGDAIFAKSIAENQTVLALGLNVTLLLL